MLDDQPVFPPVSGAEEGIVAVGGDLSVERLLAAYSQGIFPWYSDGEPIIWWSPDPRFIIPTAEIHVSKSMRRVLNAGYFRCTWDTCFADVMAHCAQVERKGEQGTWITDEMMQAYITLHESGFAHSLEVWHQDRLVGGVYGVSLGHCFFAESMFHLETNASKFALIQLSRYLQSIGFEWIDAQVYTEHVASLGGRDIPREEFLQLLHRGLQYPTLQGKWDFKTA